MYRKSEKSFVLAVALKNEDAERAGLKPAPTTGANSLSHIRYMSETGKRETRFPEKALTCFPVSELLLRLDGTAHLGGGNDNLVRRIVLFRLDCLCRRRIRNLLAVR